MNEITLFRQQEKVFDPMCRSDPGSRHKKRHYHTAEYLQGK